MFDFSALKSAQNDRSQQSQQRQQQSELAYQEGLKWLAHYNQKPDKETLLKAMQAMISASTYQRNRAEPLAVLAYIYYALRSPQLAAKYFRLAQAANPQAKVVARMRDVLTERPTVSTFGDNQTFALPELDTVDYDALYDEAEGQIRELLRQLLRCDLKQPLLTTKDLLRVAEQDCAQMLQTHQALSQQLDIINEDIDIAPLQRQLYPVEQRLNTYQKWLAVSRMACQLAEHTTEYVRQTVAALEQQPLPEPLLDPLLDGCDAIADQIDALQAQGYGTEGLEQIYGQLTQKVMEFQDLLEA